MRFVIYVFLRVWKYGFRSSDIWINRISGIFAIFWETGNFLILINHFDRLRFWCRFWSIFESKSMKTDTKLYANQHSKHPRKPYPNYMGQFDELYRSKWVSESQNTVKLIKTNLFKISISKLPNCSLQNAKQNPISQQDELQGRRHARSALDISAWPFLGPDLVLRDLTT